jgi:hypothetical protein
VEDWREISRRGGEKQAIQGGDPHRTLTALCSLGSQPIAPSIISTKSTATPLANLCSSSS